MNPIEIKNLTFGYSTKVPILKNLNLSVPQGAIYGFLGANGAGKSTTIRNILGLLKPQQGDITILGKTLSPKTLPILQNVGSLIESPSLYPHLSARNNLKIACNYYQVPYSRIAEVLDIVKLTNYNRKAVGKFSTGMKQRTGLAMALIHDPNLLILDEPSSGLDPNGILEMRHIIQDLNASGKTIMLSSHLLTEVERMVTHIGIIQDGEMKFEGSMSDLNNLKKDNQKVSIRTSDPAASFDLIAKTYKAEKEQGYVHTPISKDHEIALVVQALVRENIDVYEVKTSRTDLENLFMDITNT